jgi:hypothetical protein
MYNAVLKEYETMVEILDLHKSLMSNIYSEAVIYGKQFKSRGIEYKETTLAYYEANSNKYRVCNPLNKLINNWYHKNSKDSWFKCTVSEFNYRNVLSSKDYYGQFNFFFTIPEFKNDPFISGLHYSSVLLRKYETNNFIDSITVTENSDSLYPNLYFIHNVNVYSTNYMFNAFNIKNEPLNNGNIYNNNSYKKDNKLNQIHLYPIYPSELKIRIREIDLFVNNKTKSIFFKKEIN